MSQKVNDFTVRFKTGLSRLIVKLSLVTCLKLFVSENEISKWLKSTVQSHGYTWSETADSFTLLKRLRVKFEIPTWSAGLVKTLR